VDTEDYLTPIVAAVVGGIITIAAAYIGTKVMTYYADRRLKALKK
jgi:hypothetical protein